jgi:hypothetical protein
MQQTNKQASPDSAHAANRSELADLRRLCANGQAQQALHNCRQLLRFDPANPKLILLQQARASNCQNECRSRRSCVRAAA